MRPWAVYGLVYPDEQIDLRKIAYFFSYAMDDVVPQAELKTLHALVKDWQERWQANDQPVLVYRRAPDWLQVLDHRDPATPQVHVFHGVEATIYELCGDTDRAPARVADQLRREYGAQADVEMVSQILNRFCEMGLMIEENNHYLSLALPGPAGERQLVLK